MPRSVRDERARGPAFRLDQPVVASVCLHRTPDGEHRVLSPCGVCLERLAVHGPHVLVAVPEPAALDRVRWITLRQALPHYWIGVPGGVAAMVSRLRVTWPVRWRSNACAYAGSREDA